MEFQFGRGDARESFYFTHFNVYKPQNFPKFGKRPRPPRLAPLLSSRSAGRARASRGSARDTVS